MESKTDLTRYAYHELEGLFTGHQRMAEIYAARGEYGLSRYHRSVTVEVLVEMGLRDRRARELEDSQLQFP